jgi:hypothetical protein
MAKPIFIIKLPEKSIDLGDVEKLITPIQRDLYDYHVLCIFHEGNNIEIEIFYEKDFNEVKFEELKEIVKENIYNHQKK